MNFALPGSEKQTFKTVGKVTLSLHIFYPKCWEASDRRAGIVFFFGGGWVGGSPEQFIQQCRYLATRGMVAASAEYRVKDRHGTTPLECIADGKSAVRWMRTHASELGIDPNRLAAGGGSAGGHVAACTGIAPGLEEKGEDLSVSSVPDALVLFNPAVNVFDSQPIRRLERFGHDEKAMHAASPLHQITSEAPPTILFHGEADDTVPVDDVRRFEKAMRDAGNTCVLKTYKGCPHGFFNYGRDADHKHFRLTLTETDQFLISLGYLDGKPETETFLT